MLGTEMGRNSGMGLGEVGMGVGECLREDLDDQDRGWTIEGGSGCLSGMLGLHDTIRSASLEGRRVVIDSPRPPEFEFPLCR